MVDGQLGSPVSIRRMAALPANLVQTLFNCGVLWGVLYVLIPPPAVAVAHVVAAVVTAASLLQAVRARVVREADVLTVHNKWRTYRFVDIDSLQAVPTTPWWSPVALAGLPTVVGFYDEETGRTVPAYALGYMDQDRMRHHPTVRLALTKS